MVDSAHQEWQPSPIGITIPRVKQKSGTTRVQKIDVVGAPRSASKDEFHVVLPGLSQMTGAGSQAVPAASQQRTARPAAGRVCSVCTRASADYSCPKCLIGYCSSKCYKTHGSQCTEAFFRGHVERETKIQEDGEGRVGPLERRECMVQLLRKLRESDRAQNLRDEAEKFSGHRVASGADPGVAESVTKEEEEEEDDRFVRERLETLRLALSAPIALPSPHTQSPAKPAARAACLHPSSPRGEEVKLRKDQTHVSRSYVGRWPKLQADSRGLEERPEDRIEKQQFVGDDDESFMDLLTEAERSRFLREVASGRLGRLIVPWKPWWTQACGVLELSQVVDSRPPHPVTVLLPKAAFPSNSGYAIATTTQPPAHETQEPGEGLRDVTAAHGRGRIERRQELHVDLVDAAADVAEVEQKEEEGQECSRHTFSTLSHLANQVPEFSALCARPPSPSLPALATDFIYAYAFTARLYNGCWCSDPVEASLALIGASPVLRDGATPSTVDQALVASLRRAVESEGVGFRGYAESLREDVLMLCSHHLKLSCALQDARCMLDAANRALSPTNSAEPSDFKKGQGMVEGKPGGRKRGKKKMAKELGKVEKRIGYFLSWALSYGERDTPAMAAAVRNAVSRTLGPLAGREAEGVGLVS